MASLTDKQRRFVREYLIDLNATKAAIRAGYSAKTADQIGHQLLNKTLVKQAVEKAQQARSERTQIDADYVLKRLVEIDEMDVADILTSDGAVLPVSQWPKVWRTTLSGFEVLATGGEDTSGLLKKIKWPDKVKNLELLGKHVSIGAFKEKLDMTSSDGSMSPKAAVITTPEQFAEIAKEIADRV